MKESSEIILKFLKEFNLQTILSLAAIVWYFSRSIKYEMKLLETKIDKQSSRTDRLYEMFIDLIKERNK